METSSSQDQKEKESALKVSVILQRLKKHLGITTNRELSDILGVKSNTLSTWKKRESMDYERIISVCRSYEIDINKLLFYHNGLPAKPQEKTEKKGFPVILRDSYYQYVTHLHDTSYINTLPRFDFPFITGNNIRAFQIVGSEMYPLLKDEDFVLGEYVEKESHVIVNGGIYVLVSHVRGIFISQVKTDAGTPDVLYLNSNNNRVPALKVTMHTDEIVELRKVTSVFSIKLIGKR